MSMLALREERSFKMMPKTVNVLLSSEVIWQGVPNRQANHSKGPMAERTYIVKTYCFITNQIKSTVDLVHLLQLERRHINCPD